ncbi:MAG: hypothetical protein WCO45_19145 [Pseudanabaena sp. ELA607]
MIENSLNVKKSDRRTFMRLPIEERRRILDWTSFSLEADRELPLA